ncbi:hypothetical protein [Chlamydiifrater volucris]|uniref:hypothetical protein n=1 Tax=Chlamydiifrater volucris TaxID=2681470 RepID=UPI001BCD362B|nr:hypothetical protein [Chlamydiifrater volucris]
MTNPVNPRLYRSQILTVTSEGDSLKENEKSIEEKVHSAFLILKDLLTLSSEENPPGTSQQERPVLHQLEMYDSIVVQALGQQISRLLKETAQTCSQVARAVIMNNMSIEGRLQSCQLFTRDELEKLKTTLQDLSESGSSSSKRSLEEGKSLPLKKRKYIPADEFSPLVLPETSSTSAIAKALQSTQVLCHKESLLALLTMVEKKLKWTINNFTCPQHTPPGCTFCAPICALMFSPKEEIPQLSDQLQILLQYTSKERLAGCLSSNTSLLQNLLKARFFRNHQLAIILSECDISDDICCPNVPNPKHQVQIYTLTEQLITAGPNSPFVQTIRKLWKQSTLEKLEDSLELSLNDQGTTKQSITRDLFIALLPKLHRTYYFLTSDKKYRNFSDRPITPPFARFLANAAFATVQSIIESKECSEFLTKTPEGKLLPSYRLLIQVLCLILSSSIKWKLRLLPCKASIKVRHHLAFDESTTRILHEEFSLFAQRNHINVSGSSTIRDVKPSKS